MIRKPSEASDKVTPTLLDRMSIDHIKVILSRAGYIFVDSEKLGTPTQLMYIFTYLDDGRACGICYSFSADRYNNEIVCEEKEGGEVKFFDDQQLKNIQHALIHNPQILSPDFKKFIEQHQGIYDSHRQQQQEVSKKTTQKRNAVHADLLSLLKARNTSLVNAPLASRIRKKDA